MLKQNKLRHKMGVARLIAVFISQYRTAHVCSNLALPAAYTPAPNVALSSLLQIPWLIPTVAKSPPSRHRHTPTVM